MCLSPLHRSFFEDGSSALGHHAKAVRVVGLPCGKCLLCRDAIKREWFVRVWCEGYAHEISSVVHLTYRDADLPAPAVDATGDLVRFVKRVRHSVSGSARSALRFFIMGEHSPDNARLHYHGIIFGWFPPDARRLSDGGHGGKPIWSSSELERLWGLGDRVRVQEFVKGTANYVVGHTSAKLALPKFLGYATPPEYKSKGLGGAFYAKHGEQVRQADFIVIDGKKWRVPRYFDKLTERRDPLHLAELKAGRELRATKTDAHHPDRLRARAVEIEQRLKAKRRKSF